MKIRENNLIEICKKHGVVYNVVIYDHLKPARQSLVACKCDEFDSSVEAKHNGYVCSVKNCKNSAECIFSKLVVDNTQKVKRPILMEITKNNKKVYGCIHYNWNGEPLNEKT